MSTQEKIDQLLAQARDFAMRATTTECGATQMECDRLANYATALAEYWQRKAARRLP